MTGWGEDATGLTFGRFLSGDWSPGVTFDRIHSGPLDIAATQGILSVVALGVVLVVLLHGTWRARSGGETGALAAACIGYSVWVLPNFDWAPATGAGWLIAGTAWSAGRAFDVARAQPQEIPSPAVARPAAWRAVLAIALAVAAIALGALPVLADVWYLQGRTELAVRVDPLQARYHWALGQALVAQDQKARGVDEMLRAADLGESEPGLYVDLGDAEAQLNRFADARRDYKRALKIDPYYAPASERLAAMGT